jgi:hypothetical protein
MLTNVNCPSSLFEDESPFVEFQNSHLSEIGVTTNSDLVLAPDWTLVVALLIAMFTMVVVVVGFLYYFRKQAWSSHTDITTSYRTQQAKMGSRIKASKGGYYSKLRAHRQTHNGGDGEDGGGACGCSGGGMGGLLGCLACRSARVGAAADGEEEDDTPPSIGIRSVENEDIEAAAAISRSATEPGEGESEDGGAVSKSLQRQLQGTNDKIEGRMLETNDLLVDLRASLKKEVHHATPHATHNPKPRHTSGRPR